MGLAALRYIELTVPAPKATGNWNSRISRKVVAISSNIAVRVCASPNTIFARHFQEIETEVSRRKIWMLQSWVPSYLLAFLFHFSTLFFYYVNESSLIVTTLYSSANSSDSEQFCVATNWLVIRNEITMLSSMR